MDGSLCRHSQVGYGVSSSLVSLLTGLDLNRSELRVSVGSRHRHTGIRPSKEETWSKESTFYVDWDSVRGRVNTLDLLILRGPCSSVRQVIVGDSKAKEDEFPLLLGMDHPNSPPSEYL